jgi:hypothetical protein
VLVITNDTLCAVAAGVWPHDGRENQKMMLYHYQQTKNMLVSCSNKPLNFF